MKAISIILLLILFLPFVVANETEQMSNESCMFIINTLNNNIHNKTDTIILLEKKLANQKFYILGLFLIMIALLIKNTLKKRQDDKQEQKRKTAYPKDS